MKYTVLCIAVIAALTSPALGAVSLINGEFDTPTVTANGGQWEQFANGSVPGWSSSEGVIELWSQGAFSSPVNGSDGLPTGQHMELNANGLGTVVQAVVPTGVSLVTLSFDAWLRGNATGTFTIGRTVSGDLGPNTILTSTTAWVLNALTFSVSSGETVTLSFSSTSGDSANSVHIDQVSLAAVPEPATIVVWGGLAAIGGIVAYRRRVAC